MGPRLRGWLDTRGRGSRSRELDTSIVDTLTVDRNIVDTLTVDSSIVDTLTVDPGCGHWRWTLAVGTGRQDNQPETG